MKNEHWTGWVVGLIMGVILGGYAVWDGYQPHPERPEPSAHEWAER